MKPPRGQALLALGGNLGDRADTLGQALAALAGLPDSRLLACSSALETDPVGRLDQPPFLNLCAALETTLAPRDLLAAGLAIETRLGRVRNARNGPRTCDIDLLFHTAGTLDEPDLTLPHPRWAERGFVVFPLRELLQMTPLASDSRWDWLRTEAARTEVSQEGLRPWTGPTPWTTPPR